jgi:hypothetical protein
MQGELTYMKVDKLIMAYEGCLEMLILKAMYSCIQASALWYALIQSFLEDQGCEGSETNRCVFCKKNDDRIYVLLLYIDDILADVGKQEEIEKL